MTAALTALCILGVTVLLGLVLLAPAYRLIHAVGLIALPLAGSLLATGYRFSTEVLHDAYIDVPSDTSRYLEFGRYRFLEGAAAGAGLSDGNGTDATIALSQAFFSVLGDHPFAVEDGAVVVSAAQDAIDLAFNQAGGSHGQTVQRRAGEVAVPDRAAVVLTF